MPEPSKTSESIVQPTPPTGKVNIHAAREGLAMVMDALRVMEAAGVKISRAFVPLSGKTCALPMIEIPGHRIGILVMDDGKSVFTTDGTSVMDALPVMDDGHGQEKNE